VRIAFFGTPDFAVPSLDAIAGSRHELAVVVTQPDKPRGRGKKVTPAPVKAKALELGVPVLQPAALKPLAFAAELAALRLDLAVVAAYGRILPAHVLAIPRLGMINVHASLLPRWRGAAPVHRAVLAGDRESGVTIMRVVEALDAGPMLAKLPTPIGDDETSAELERRLAVLGADLLGETIEALVRGPVTEAAQDEQLVTYAHRLERRESSLDWAQPAAAVHNEIRGLTPWPLASSLLTGRRLILHRSRVAEHDAVLAVPGTVLSAGEAGLVVAAAHGSVMLTEVQIEGRPPMTVRAFLNGHRVKAGEKLERWTPPVQS
jgi:methionyl-tRNA formyltransferase